MQGVHVVLTPALQQTILTQFETVLRNEPQIVRIHVHLEKDQELGRRHHFRATARVERRGPDVIAEIGGEDAYGALNALAHRVNDIISREHGKSRTKRHHPHGVELPADLPKI